ncbi:MAG TPA: hypothetical protein IGR64_09385 [Leptolyngbyaceae cyanobacterium M65_K2018_010]|nr:hypothetical protein [Leptolyngbyaceae cyanobacterium M65_K2018_010]
MTSSTTAAKPEALNFSDPQDLLLALQDLRHTVDQEGQATFEAWRSHIQRPEFLPSALNLAQYLALRRHDLRFLQAKLMPWGLSSLGRIEARVMPNLDAVIATLAVICGADPAAQNRPPIESFFEGNHLLRQNTEVLFGPASPSRRVRIMVTLPTQAATDDALVREMLRRGANCVRINCAHDTPATWQAMIAQVRRAEQDTGHRCKVMMDLGGPKIRTGPVFAPTGKARLFRGDSMVLWRQAPLPNPPSLAQAGESPPGEPIQTSCTVPEILDLLTVGTPVYIDDGKLRTQVIDTHYPVATGPEGILLQVTHARPKGVKLRPEKGLNFPNTVLPLSPLTEKDLQDLDFVALHADIVGYSFVQTAADIERLQQELPGIYSRSMYNRFPVPDGGYRWAHFPATTMS